MRHVGAAAVVAGVSVVLRAALVAGDAIHDWRQRAVRHGRRALPLLHEVTLLLRLLPRQPGGPALSAAHNTQQERLRCRGRSCTHVRSPGRLGELRQRPPRPRRGAQHRAAAAVAGALPAGGRRLGALQRALPWCSAVALSWQDQSADRVASRGLALLHVCWPRMASFSIGLHSRERR
jgi:hypothetical protein